MRRRDRLGRRIGHNRWRRWITDEWRSADLVWLSRAEEFSNGHRTELEEFRILEPRPNLRDYMLSLSPAYHAGGCPIRERR